MKFIKLIVLVSALCLFGCDDKPAYQTLDSDAVVLALGDSLTAGYGAQSVQSYPTLLNKQTPWTVINAGVSGDTSTQALERLPALLRQHQPDLVIVSIGGNDFLQQLNESATEQTIDTIIADIKDSGGQVLLVGVPYFSVRAALGFPKDHDMYERLAERHDIALLSNAWSDILSKKTLRYDEVHPNAEGYAVFTDTLLNKLSELGWR